MVSQSISSIKLCASPQREIVHDFVEMLDMKNLIRYKAFIHEFGTYENDPELFLEKEGYAFLDYMVYPKLSPGRMEPVHAAKTKPVLKKRAAKTKPVPKKRNVIINKPESTISTEEVCLTTYHYIRGASIPYK